MNATNDPSSIAAVAVVLDVVDSRSHPDQAGVLAEVAAQVQRCLVTEGAATSAGATIGDELQALYAPEDLVAAVRDLAVLRLSLRADDGPAVRCGLGSGDVIPPVADDLVAVQATTPGQSGTAWWRAREAVHHVERPRRGWPLLRWWYVGDGGADALVRGVLVAADTLMAGMDGDDARAAVALLRGASAGDVAAALGVSASAASRRLHGHGVYGLVRTLETLGAP